MTLNALFKMVRELQRKDQTELAQAIGLKSSSAISKFEKGEEGDRNKKPLSDETLRNLAPLLQLNPDYITGESANPFLSDELIKMFLPEEYAATKVLFTPIHIIVEANQFVEIVSLLPARKFEFLEKLEAGRAVETPPYAMAIKDQDNNIFLFRRKSPTAYVMADRGMLAELREIADRQGKVIRQSTRRLSRNIFELIKNWTVSRQDIEPFFARGKMVELTAEEEKLILKVREGKKDLVKVNRCIDDI